MDAHDVLVQINEYLMSSTLSDREVLLLIDDIVAEYFIQLREELEEDD